MPDTGNIKCPLCGKALADMHALQHHWFSPRHDGGREVMDFIHTLLEPDEEYSKVSDEGQTLAAKP